MKLQHLHIDDYKNLKNFDIDFSDNNVTALIGTNGSGKSNIIEALSGLYNSDTPELKFFCKISYTIANKKVAFIRAPGYKYMTLDTRESDISFEEYKRNKFAYLPSQIISSYSGESKRLWEGFYKSVYLDYIKSVKQIQVNKQFMKYINHYHWSICLLLLAIYKPEDYEKLHLPHIKEVLFEFANKDISSFQKNDVINLLIDDLHYNSNRGTLFPFEAVKTIFESNYVAQDIFNYLVLASLPKDDKLIQNFTILFESDYSLAELSEGEKKLITLTAIYELLVDNETLVLLDEPDTYVHEGKKHLVYESVKRYADDGICTVLTTHSPTLTNIFTNSELKVLINNGTTIEILTQDKKQAISRLTNGIWCAEAQCILFESQCDLLLVEGKGDTKYIKNAINYFRGIDEKYKKINLFVLPFGGTGNCSDFLKNIIEAGIVNRKIVALFDADGSGRKKFSELVGRKGDNYTDKIYEINDFTRALLLPKPTEDKNAEFMIEDYFDLSGYEKERDRRYGVCKGVKAKSEFKYSAKDYVADHCDDIGYAGFDILCNKLIEVLESF